MEIENVEITTPRERNPMQYIGSVKVTGKIIAQSQVEAENRGRAVQKILQWFWDTYEGTHGPAGDVLTVNDPSHEVRFTHNFNCARKGNNYLDDAVAERVILESHGALERDTKKGTPHHPRRSLRVKKRRRKYLVRVAPNIYESNSGVYYYRITLTPQVSKNGVVVQERKLKDVRLEATTIAGAIEEIRTKKLKDANEKNSLRKKIKVRSLKLASHVAGLTVLSSDDKNFFAPVLEAARPDARAQ